MKAISTHLVREGNRIRLTRLTLDHIRHHYAWNNDPVLNHFDSEVPFEEESYLSFARRFEAMLLGTGNTYYLEVQTLDGAPIGVAALSQLSNAHHHAGVSVTIGERDLWGQGYGQEALQLALAYAFDELGVHRVSAESFAFNTAWKRVLDRAGFVSEGRQRDYLFRDGAFWDNESYAMLAHEYQARRATPIALRTAA